MAWIELHQSLPGHRKTRQAARALTISRSEFIGHIIQFWLWALDNAPDGKLLDIDAETIADVSDWDGDPDQYLTVLVAAGFIDIDEEENKTIHDWWDYAGKLIDSRRRDRERKRVSKGIPTEGARNSNGKDTIPAENTQFQGHRTQPNPTVPNTPQGDGSPDSEPALFLDNGRSYPADYTQWWEGYPKQIDQAGCLKLYRAQKKRLGAGAAALLLVARDNYIASLSEMRFAVKPEKFLSTGHSFVDEWAKVQIKTDLEDIPYLPYEGESA